MNKYIEERMDLPYYRIVKDQIKEIAPETMLDVGCHGMDIFNEVEGEKTFIDLYGNFPETGEHIKIDINEFETEKKWEVITCLQTLEHIEDIESACNKLKGLYTKALIISLPYKWAGKQDDGHKHKNIDMKKIIELLGEPNIFIRTKLRIIGVYNG